MDTSSFHKNICSLPLPPGITPSSLLLNRHSYTLHIWHTGGAKIGRTSKGGPSVQLHGGGVEGRRRVAHHRQSGQRAEVGAQGALVPVMPVRQPRLQVHACIPPLAPRHGLRQQIRALGIKHHILNNELMAPVTPHGMKTAALNDCCCQP